MSLEYKKCFDCGCKLPADWLYPCCYHCMELYVTQHNKEEDRKIERHYKEIWELRKKDIAELKKELKGIGNELSNESQL